MKEMTGKELLKLMAQQAKNRMRGKTEGLININKYVRSKSSPLVESKRISEEEDKNLYNKVYQMLSQNEDVVNPLDELIEIEKYRLLDYQQQERYLLKLADKYQLLKNRYETEKLSKSV